MLACHIRAAESPQQRGCGVVYLQLPGELGSFLFRHWQKRVYNTELFEKFRQAHYQAEAIYALPFTVAEGLAAKHKIKSDIFLKRIEEQLTVGEKLRLQSTAERQKIDLSVDWKKLSLTRLALYILSLSVEKRRSQAEFLNNILEQSARLTLAKVPCKLGKVAAVLDCSYSSSGSSEKRRRPLGVALAVHYLLQAAAYKYRAFWTVPVEMPLLLHPRGQTDLATPLLDALEWDAQLVVIVSDGWENDPPCGGAEVLRVYRSKLDPKLTTSIVHCNPVFNADNFSLKNLSAIIPTVGLREAEDLPTMLSFARFAEGIAPLSELETYLATRVQLLLKS